MWKSISDAHAIDATLSLIQVPDGPPRAPEAPQGDRHLSSRGRDPRRRRALEGFGRPPSPARPRAARAQGAPLAAPGPARRRRGGAPADAGAAGGPRGRLPPPRGEHVRGLRGRRPTGRRLARLGGRRLKPLPLSVQAFSTCERPAFGTRPPRHAPQCLPAFLFVTVLRPDDSITNVTPPLSRGLGFLGSAAAIGQRKHV